MIALSVLIVILAIYAALSPFIETAWLIEELKTDGYVKTEEPSSDILRDLFKANPSLFSGTQQIVSVTLPANQPIDERLFQAICNHPELTDFSAADHVSDANVDSLLRLENLESLSIENESFTDEGLKVVSKLKSLKRLTLENCSISDDGFTHLKSLDKLESLIIQNADISDLGLSAFNSLRNLNGVFLSGMPFSGTGFCGWKSSSSITGLLLSKTAVNDSGLREISNFRRLEGLYLEETLITDEGLLSRA